MKEILILHGTNADHTSNWFPWLKQELTFRGYKVWVPDLPHPDEAHYDINEYKDYILSQWKFNSDSILIGHSGGSVVILDILESLPEDSIVNKVIFVSGYTDDQGWPALKRYFSTNHDWDAIRKHVKYFVLFHSDDDPYMSKDHSSVSSNRLRAELRIFSGYGHFNLEKSQQFKQFPELLEKILE